MDRTYWLKQTVEAPLFEDLLWSRPEHKSQAGKLLVIGGNLHGFAAPAEAYQAATEAGIGSVRVLLPNSLKKIVGSFIEHGEYTASTPSGSFARAALAEALEQAEWSDGILLAGDFGRNSETAILIESFLQKYSGPVAATKDAVDYLITAPQVLLARPQTTLVLTITQLQHLLTALKWPAAVPADAPLLRLVDLLHELTTTYTFNIVLQQELAELVAATGQVSTTKRNDNHSAGQVTTAARCSVWWVQNPSKVFAALTTGVLSPK